MKGILFGATFMTAALLFAFTIEAGETGAGEIQIGLETGYTVPLGEFGDTYSGSFFVGADCLYGITDHLSAGFGVMSAFDHEPESNTPPGSDASALLLGATPTVAYTRALSEALSLRVSVNGGPYYLRQTTEVAQMLPDEIRQTASTFEDWEWGFGAGGGIEYGFNEHLSFGVEIDYLVVLDGGDQIQLFLPQFRLGYTF